MRKLDRLGDVQLVHSSVEDGGVNQSVLLGLLNELHRRHISYCYWKGTRRIRAVLAGEGDVDLLVAKEHQHRCEAIMLERGFKRFPSAPNRDHPSISSFLGFEEVTGRLVHLHLHFRLIVGEPLLKNYRLPWEGFILARAILDPTLSIRILDAPTEALLLAVRACLELRRSDPIAVRDWGVLTGKFADDRIDVARRVRPLELREVAAGLLGEELAEMVSGAIFGEGALQDQHRLRRRLTGHLAPYRTYNAFEARLRMLGRAIAWTAGTMNRQFVHLPRPWSRRAPGGGCVAALVGVDGSGKSTVVAAIREWLVSEIDVISIYFGTGAGRPSLLLAPLKLMVPVFTRVFGNKPRGSSHGIVSGHAPGPLYSALLMVWAMVVAREKRAKLLAARRAADRGLVVLTDRYPQDEIIGFNDGPLLVRLSRVPRRLRRFEGAAYALARRLPPDLAIKLDVLAATAARREPDMDPALVRERIADLQRLTFAGSRVVRVDAEQPLADVIRSVQREIWRLL